MPLKKILIVLLAFVLLAGGGVVVLGKVAPDTLDVLLHRAKEPEVTPTPVVYQEEVVSLVDDGVQREQKRSLKITVYDVETELPLKQFLHYLAQTDPDTGEVTREESYTDVGGETYTAAEKKQQLYTVNEDGSRTLVSSLKAITNANGVSYVLVEEFQLDTADDVTLNFALSASDFELYAQANNFVIETAP